MIKKRFIILLAIIFMFTSLTAVNAQGINNQVFLPLIVNPEPIPTEPIPTQPIPTQPIPTEPTSPPPPSGGNVQCAESGGAQICAWVSNTNPIQNSDVTVYGRLLINNAAQPNQSMSSTWHYKSTTQSCQGSTGVDGVAACTRGIGGASHGYQVNIDVSISGYSVRTWFTPQ